ncbi:MAG: GNAT family N-acetyltransferase [Bacteroidetes bacterium]|nr:GNAT family N-acetyltransferase [Bacteroidota bacterium]
MKLIEVTNKSLAKKFVKVAHLVYKDDPHWVCPLDSMINAVFNPKKNVFYAHGDAIRWILVNDKDELIGRVAAFVNEKKAYNFDQPTGGMGFFECIDDENAAFLIFDKCVEWLKEKGMKAIDGPINFGENDNFWGLLVEGFMHPSFGMNYHLPYYKKFFENYGFESYFEQVTNHLDLTVPFPEKFWKIADWIRKKPAYDFRHLQLKQSDKFIDDLKTIYDTAWQYHENFTPISRTDLQESFNQAKAIIDEEFVWFVYNNDKPIAFLVMFPDANQILKRFKGKMHLINKLRFVLLAKMKTMTRTRITIMGVVPKFQKSGVESGIFWHMDKVMKKKPHYTEVEMSWVGDFNPKMQAIHHAVGGKFAKKHITYRKLFSGENIGKRSTVIPRNTKDKG